MSLRAMLWALNEAPVDNPTDAMILVALADNADEEGRMAYPSISTIAARARISERTVQRRLPELVEEGLLELGDQDAIPQWHRRDRRPTVYNLRLSQRRGDNLTPRENGDGVTSEQHGVTPVSPEPSYNPRLLSKPPSEAGRASRGPVSRPSRASRLRQAQADEDALDPFKAVGLWDQPKDEPERAPRRRRHPGDDTPMGLALRFRDRANVAYKTISASNEKALSGAFREWLANGVSADEIRSMIDVFCNDKRWSKRGVDLWRSFLYRREALLAAVRDRAAYESAADSGDWFGFQETTEETTDVDWFGVGSGTTTEEHTHG